MVAAPGPGTCVQPVRILERVVFSDGHLGAAAVAAVTSRAAHLGRVSRGTRRAGSGLVALLAWRLGHSHQGI